LEGLPDSTLFQALGNIKLERKFETKQYWWSSIDKFVQISNKFIERKHIIQRK